MKQKLFLAAMAAIAMTSCSNDETLEINTGTERAIDFRTAMATRATETTIVNLNSFYVTAFNENKLAFPYFENLEFTKTKTDAEAETEEDAEEEGSTYFVSEKKYYYPGDGTNLTFYAYAPSATDLGTGSSIATDNTNKNLTLTDFSPATDISKQVDFITANATGNKSNAETGVPLVFKHRLSQIKINATTQNGGTYVYNVKGIRIAQVASKGNFAFKEEKWANLGEKNNYECTFNEAIEINQNETELMAACGTAMLIPQELQAWDKDNDKPNNDAGAYISLYVRITTKDGALVYPFNDNENEYAWAAIPVGTTWEAGKRYVYTLRFNEGAGYVDPEEKTHQGEQILNGEVKFEVSVDDWEKEAYDGWMSSGDVDINPGDIDNETDDPFGDL